MDNYYTIFTHGFEYDPAKSVSNLSKHGIDFDQAQALWDDPWLLEAPAKTEDELRFVSIGKIEGGHLDAARGCGADHLGAPRPERGDRIL